MAWVFALATLPGDWMATGDGDGDFSSTLLRYFVAWNFANVYTASTAGLSVGRLEGE